MSAQARATLTPFPSSIKTIPPHFPPQLSFPVTQTKPDQTKTNQGKERNPTKPAPRGKLTSTRLPYSTLESKCRTHPSSSNRNVRTYVRASVRGPPPISPHNTCC